MHAKLMHAQRGQAIVETVVFLPMFLLVLFGIIWTVRAAVQYERAESAVRYSGLISQRANPYTGYSMYAMYLELQSGSVPTVTCVLPLTAALSDASPTYASQSTPTASTPFWSPTNATPSCPLPGIVGIPAGTDLYQDVVLIQQWPGITSTISVPPALAGTLGSLTSTSADAHFFQQVGVDVILGCYPALRTQIQSSLDIQSDLTIATLPVQLGSTVTPLSLSPNSSCTTF